MPRRRKVYAPEKPKPTWLRVLDWIEAVSASPLVPRAPYPTDVVYMQQHGSRLRQVTVIDFKRFAARHRLSEVETAKLIFRSYDAYHKMATGGSMSLKAIENAYDIMYRIDNYVKAIPRTSNHGHICWQELKDALAKNDPYFKAYENDFDFKPAAKVEDNMGTWEP